MSDREHATYKILVQQHQRGQPDEWLTVEASVIRDAATPDEAIARFVAAFRRQPDHGPVAGPPPAASVDRARELAGLMDRIQADPGGKLDRILDELAAIRSTLDRVLARLAALDGRE